MEGCFRTTRERIRVNVFRLGAAHTAVWTVREVMSSYAWLKAFPANRFSVFNGYEILFLSCYLGMWLQGIDYLLIYCFLNLTLEFRLQKQKKCNTLNYLLSVSSWFKMKMFPELLITRYPIKYILLTVYLFWWFYKMKITNMIFSTSSLSLKAGTMAFLLKDKQKCPRKQDSVGERIQLCGQIDLGLNFTSL